MLRLSDETVKGLILHVDRDVRGAAAFYSVEVNPSDPEILRLAIEAYQRFGLDAFAVDSFLSQLDQTDESVAWVLSEIECIAPQPEEREWLFLASLKGVLRTCDPQLVNRRRSAIESLKNLDVAFRRILADRIAVDAMSADQLWTELNRWCDDHDDFTALEHDEHQHALALVSAMARRPEEFGAGTSAVIRSGQTR